MILNELSVTQQKVYAPDDQGWDNKGIFVDMLLDMRLFSWS